MKENLTAETSIEINADTLTVWKTLTDPKAIEKYLMGTHVKTDWKEGSPITYEGEYQGKKYQDKGVLKKVVPGEILQSTYWSSMGGKEDKPENYNLVTYRLSKNGSKTVLKLSQDNVQSDKEKEHVLENWKSVLTKIKEVVESKIVVAS